MEFTLSKLLPSKSIALAVKLLLLSLSIFLPSNIAGADESGLLYPMRTDWESSNSQSKMSAYTFYDLNENGIYDLGDRVLTNIAVAVGKDQLLLGAARSNLNGFANFTVSTTFEDVIIKEVGTYAFQAFAPPGWWITTRNGIQQRDLIEIKGSISGLGPTRALDLIGFARHKFIRGTYTGSLPASISLLSDDEEIAQTELEPGEEFLLPAPSGKYSLVAGDYTREVTIGKYPVDIGKIGTVYDFASPGGTLIDFEEVAPTGLLKAPNGYSGLNWFNLNIMSYNLVDDSIGLANGTTSGNHSIYSSSGYRPAFI